MGALRQISSRGNAPVVTDALDTALAALDDIVWSDNVAGNSYKGNIPVLKTDPNFTTYYGYNGAEPTVSNFNPMAFGGGDYYPGRKEYWYTGGGHDDWLGSEIQKLDMATLEWSLTDTSCQYSTTETDTGAPFQSTDNLNWKTWPNDAGRRTPPACHMYAGMAAMPERDAIFAQGAASFKGGNGGAGGFFPIDVTTGHWDETGAHANTTMGAGTNCVSLWMPDVLDTDTDETVGRVLRHSGTGSLWLIDPGTGDGVQVASNFSVSAQAGAVGTIIPDPFNAGRRAYVAPKATSDTSNLAIAKRIDAFPALASPNDRIVSQAYGNSVPAEITSMSGMTWIYMGYEKATTKIVVFSTTGGIFTLDTDGWNWSDQIVGLPTGWSTLNTDTNPYKRFFYMADYDCFGLIDAHDGQLYVIKLPASVYA